MQPTNRSDSNPMTRTLSDYSDYSSSASDSDDDAPSSRDQRTVASSSTSYAAQSDSTKSYTHYLDPNERGKSKGLLEEDDDAEDPFADFFERESLYSVNTPGIQEKRLDWAEV